MAHAHASRRMAPIRQRDRQHVIHTVQHHILVVGRGVVFRCRNVQKPHVIKDCAEPGDSCCSGACNQHKTLLGIVGWAEDGQTCVDSPQGQDVFAIGNQLSPDQGGERQRPHICVLLRSNQNVSPIAVGGKRAMISSQYQRRTQ